MREKFIYEKSAIINGKELITRYYRIKNCPICGTNRDRCMRVEKNGVTTDYYCMYNTSGTPIQTQIGTAYVHNVDSVDFSAKFELRDIKPELELTPQIIKLRNSVYREFRELVKKYDGAYLNERDRNDLLKRGFTEEEILKCGFFSYPSKNIVNFKNYKCQVKTAIANILLEKFGEDILKVPGFKKASNEKTKNDFITFNYVDGYFIPYCDFSGNILALQYRLTVPRVNGKGKLMRYFWFSSDDASSGSPIDCFFPEGYSRDDIILVTEGATKAKYAACKLKIISFAEAGTGNYNTLVETIKKYEEKIQKKVSVIIALDMDRFSNADVMASQENTIKLLKENNNVIFTAEWDIDLGKGIDDNLLSSGQIFYKKVS